MDDFETFKASREKMDPSSRKFSDSKWQLAYAAYRRSRERVGDGRQSKSGEGSSRRRSSTKGKANKVGSMLRTTAVLRSEVRQNSAYSDLRLIVDLLAWVGIGVMVLSMATKLVYYTDTAVALASVMDAAFMVIAVLLVRLLAHVVIDIPDAILFEQASKDASSREESRPEGK